MRPLRFPTPYVHDHPPVKNVNQVFEGQLNFGQRASDWVAATAGSWSFILVQSALLALWVVLNVLAVIWRWDPYPFILLNLLLSLQAAYAAPIIMMSQNRQAARDRLEAHHDYEINQKAEVEIRAILDHLAAQDAALEEIHRLLAAMANGGPSTSPR